MTELYSLLLICILAMLALLLWQAKKQRFFSFAVAGFFTVGAFGIYSLVGTPEIVPLLEKREARLIELKASVVQHSEAIKKDASDTGAWVALGVDFMATGQYTASANAFKQAVLLSNGDPLLILSYAKAMIFEADGKISDPAKKSLEMVLLQQPENAEARYYLTVRKLQDGKTEEAMKDMKTLYHSLPANSALKDMINRQIGRN